MTRVAIVVDGTLPAGQGANVAACLAVGLGAGVPALAGQPLCDATGFGSLSSSPLPIAVLCGDAASFERLMLRLAQPRPADAHCVLFPRYAQAIHTAEEYRQRHAGSAHAREPMLGLALAGPSAWVRRLTGALPLLR
ncbi:DUF2000 domain-containing protein [Schlegelella sp. S2-27]|uniref:DUF2000 domain-containing protein n=1 Tax=Caldimonas mangrovi TaxID=2944811 RepID=A0ABT0YUX4_9BURK|nr:DUF2000 domain-containing protein [Caldimonas mangrovi]MCM5682556.1 DUF2000 domain-containing protein [Caldimonas mangrovi]